MKQLIAALLLALPILLNAQQACEPTADLNQDGVVGISDLLNLLSAFGDTDLDFDGIYDSVDDCVGAYDECGVCNGDGPSLPLIQSIEILYDSLYADAIDEWWVFEVGADTTFQYVCEIIYGCTDSVAENFDANANVNDGSCWSCGSPFEYSSRDYNTVEIGNDCWFAENLNTISFSNGDPIPFGNEMNLWIEGAVSSPLQCAPYFEEVVADSIGRHYNWFAIMDSRNICPINWHVPSKAEYESLESLFEPFANSAIKDDLTWDGTNESGYTALLTGYLINGGFQSDWYSTMFWYQNSPQQALWLLTQANSGNSEDFQYMEENNGVDQESGFFVRCIKD